MSDDFELEPGLTFGEWLRAEVTRELHVEKRGFFADRVARVSRRLQAGRPRTEQFEVLIPWSPVATAFTAPGKYIYFNRRLLERCPTDEVVAFVIGHEIAHHDLGHLRRLPTEVARWASASGITSLAVALLRGIQHRLTSPARECAADRAALDLCLRAGYNATKALRVFRVMRGVALDRGDIDGVYGPDEHSDRELHPDATLATKARIWLWMKRRGYLPIDDRHAEAKRYLDSLAVA